MTNKQALTKIRERVKELSELGHDVRLGNITAYTPLKTTTNHVHGDCVKCKATIDAEWKYASTEVAIAHSLEITKTCEGGKKNVR
jgi:hypothetical protein